MANPWSLYIDTIDTAAFARAESGRSMSQYDSPVMPLVAPWLLGGPILAFAHLSANARELIICVSLGLSFLFWSAFAVFFYRRVQKHRRELYPSWRAIR